MKKLIVLSIVVLFALVGAQAFASPPVPPPVEGFIIETNTKIISDGGVTDKQRYDWTYFEGWGTGAFYPNGYTGCATCGVGGVTGWGEKGFSSGAQIAYQQDFTALDGVTTFTKDFWASSTADSNHNNLVVDKIISYKANAGGKGVATHEEKVGLSVISVGKANTDTGIVSPAAGLLTLCPWAAQGGGSSGDNSYPPTNEGIAAGSKFSVSEINWTSSSTVSSTVNPALTYDVFGDTGTGTGTISAGFVVELFEGPKGSLYQMVGDPAGTFANGGTGTCWFKPVAPPIASRTSYSEHATADGTWSFAKKMHYESIMPGSSSSAATFPIGQVP